MSELYHHGILGQKWGVRRYQNEDGSLTPAGEKRYSQLIGRQGDVSVYKRKLSTTAKIGQKIFGKRDDNFMDYEIVNKEGHKVGNMMGGHYEDAYSGKIDKSKNQLDWIGIDDKYKRKHYGQDALDVYIKDCIKQGYKAIHLEAAGMDPAAQHVYEKKGFKAVGDIINDDIWDNLLPMELDLTK